MLYTRFMKDIGMWQKLLLLTYVHLPYITIGQYDLVFVCRYTHSSAVNPTNKVHLTIPCNLEAVIPFSQ